MANSPEEIRKHLKVYWLIFGALLVMTGLTVMAAGYHFLTGAGAIALGLAIAIVKGTLVGAFFMHLAEEKKIIYGILILTAVLFVPLMLLPILTTNDSPYRHTGAPGRMIYAEGHGEGHNDGAAEGATHDDAQSEGEQAGEH